MAYGTAAELESLFSNTPIVFTATSKPTQAQVEAWIDETSAWVDSMLFARYQTPVSGTESVKLLKAFVLTIVACDRVWAIVGRGKENIFLEAKKTQLLWFNKGNVSLPDAGAASGSAALSATHNFSDYDGPKVGDVI